MNQPFIMKTLAYFLDIGLYLLLAGTLTLILYKALDLLRPHWLGKSPLGERLGETPAELDAGVEELESWLTALAVIASAAPFVGLVGTVMHIIEALRNMGMGVADMSLVSGPIATALNSTLVGLASAVPAAVSHAFFQRRLQVIENRHRRKLGF